jgi:hypothetical protein
MIFRGLVKNMCGATVIMAMLFTSPAVAQNSSVFTAQGISPYIGSTVSRGGDLILGVKADLGQFPVVPVRIIPEMATSINSDNASLLVALSGQTRLFKIGAGQDRKLVPHVRAGVGTLWTQETQEVTVTLNFAYGITFESALNPEGTRLFIEHQGIDKYKTHRILVGLTWGR